jgi:hypothetical protein
MTAEALAKEAAAEVDRDAERTLVQTSARQVYRLVMDNLESVGGIESAAGICGIDRGDLRRALDRSGRYLAVEHVMAIGARMRRFNASVATLIGGAVMRPLDLLVFPRVQLTDAERAARYERLILAMPMGAELARKALETP